jgi:hypothetical protein
VTRRPGLSDYDRDTDASPQARRARSRLNQPDNRVPGTRPGDDPLGVLGGCWCGEPFGHDWAGKAGGAPHPRQAQDPPP